MRRLPILTLLALTAVAGCSDADDPRTLDDPAPPSMEPEADDAEAINALFDDLGTWTEPGESSHGVTALAPKTVDVDGATYACIVERQEVESVFTDVPASGLGQVVPGLLVQGSTIVDGAPAIIGLDRAPATLTMGPESVTVDAPSPESLSAAVSELAAGAKVDGLQAPAVSVDVVDTFEAVAVGVGLPADQIDADLADAFQDRSIHDRTVMVKMVQPLYAVSFDDDDVERATDLLAEDITLEAVEAAAADGELNGENLPAYVSQVTYGRMVVFTVTSDQLGSGAELKAAVLASMDGTIGTLDTAVADRWNAALSGASVAVMDLGVAGDVEVVLGESMLDELFGAPSMETAAPLSYQARGIDGAVVSVSHALAFEGERCAPAVDGYHLGAGYVRNDNAKDIEDQTGAASDGASSELSLRPLGGAANWQRLQFDGFIHIEQPGTYRFVVEGDDEANLSIGHIYIHDDWQVSGEYDSAEIELEAGMHPISVSYWGGSGANLLRVSWASEDAGIPLMEVPSNRLWRAAP